MKLPGACLTLGRVLIAFSMLFQPASAADLPKPISCYQDSTNAKDIEAYMSCFTADAEMIDVSRTFAGQEAIRAWALREVIPGGETFRHRRILEQETGYAKTEVNWLNWVVHYTYWWDEAGKITRMSLQYAD
ncbi:MAG: nuclear transport factor 2 family protein [Boseongicola sp. SB0664_bin_43]|uniref:Nuclear transport factor 2 family protein n=1 Tax=Boseongicola sp. SB0664_bin_43 TaxID=2604844 RepID=A0A6B0Y265_9RHOB|nr:nuclear transport factor 2 family protein [Boseongicola sp. SB0664_bin_43]